MRRRTTRAELVLGINGLALVRLGGQAAYPGEDGWAFVRAHPHLHGDYLRAFSTAGLEVVELEPPADACSGRPAR
jgi:hypothetical protein